MLEMKKMASEMAFCVKNSEWLTRATSSKMIMEEVITKLAEYLKLKVRLNIRNKTVSDCVVYFANKWIVFM